MKRYWFGPGSCWLFLAVSGMLAVAVVSCTRAPRWTPESVRPPRSLETALTNAELAVNDQRAALPETEPTTVSLTRDGTILMTLARNRSLAVQRFGPLVAATRVPEARAQFDPAILATASYGTTRRPVRTIDTSGTEILRADTSRQVDGDVSVSQFFPTGTEVFLSGAMSRSRGSDPQWDYSGSWSVEVNQALLRGAGPAVNLVALRQARNSAAASQHELRGFVMDLVQQAEDAYWELVLAKETLKIREFSVQLAQEQLELNMDFIDVGKLARGAQYSAQSELAARRADLVDARAAVKLSAVALIRLLNPENAAQWSLPFDPVDSPIVAEVQLDPDVSARLADLYRPELAQSRLDLANSDLDVVRTRNGLLPRLDAFASYGRLSTGDSFADAKEYLDDDDFDNYRLGVTFSMSPINRAERAAYRRSKFVQEQGEAALSNLEQAVETEVRNAVIEVQRQAERITATAEAVRNREEELRVELGRFKVGISTNLDVLLVQRGLIEAQVNEITARVRFIEAVTNLYNVEGTLLDRRGVGTEIQLESQK